MLAVHEAVKQNSERHALHEIAQTVFVGLMADGTAVVTVTSRQATTNRQYFIDTKNFRIKRRINGRKRPSDYLWRHLPLTKDWLEDLLYLTKSYGARYSPESDEGWEPFGKAGYTLAC
jgi:hypothetical protein